MNERWLELLQSLILLCYKGIWIYLIVVIIACICLFLAAVRTMVRKKDLDLLHYDEVLNEALAPPVSVLFPVHNREITIIADVNHLLDIHYGCYEVIVINDGSTDETMEQLMEVYELSAVKSKIHYSSIGQAVGEIRGAYRSMRYDNLVVVDKQHGGHSDALNAGIRVSQYPYFASIGPTTMLDKYAFVKIMKPIMAALPGEEIIACGGRLELANSQKVSCSSFHIQSEKPVADLPRSPLLMMQRIEYIRAFLISGLGLVRYNINTLLFTSEAFGLFKKSYVMEVGGYNPDPRMAHLELIMRLHRHMKQIKGRGRIVYIDEPVSSMKVPESYAGLHQQRIRWHRQLTNTMWEQREMAGNPKYGWMGVVTIPYFIMVEWIGPVLEIGTLLLLFVGLLLPFVENSLLVVLGMLLLLYGSLLSAAVILFEVWLARRKYTAREVTRLFLYALSESFWFRPMNNIFRIHGLIKAIWSLRGHGGSGGSAYSGLRADK